eukprot:gene5442-7159_t
MGYYRAIIKSGEISKRALDLTTIIITYNPAHYSIWHFRRKLLFALTEDLLEELAYIEEVIVDNPKNYQVWYHRQKVLEQLGDGSAEMEFTKNMLDIDEKNYHAWTYRQWAMTHFNLFPKLRQEGLGFADDMLEKDVYNNSVWNHRYFVIEKTTGFTPEVIERELKFTLEKIELAPHNESSFNYLKGAADISKLIIPISFHQLKAFHINMDLRFEPKPSSYAIGFLLTASEELAQTTTGDEQVKHISHCKELCGKLRSVDPVRVNYWNYREGQLNGLQTSDKAS